MQSISKSLLFFLSGEIGCGVQSVGTTTSHKCLNRSKLKYHRQHVVKIEQFWITGSLSLSSILSAVWEQLL